MRNAVTNVLEDIEPLAISPALSARKAAMRDIPALLRLINHYAAEGIMLPRTEFEISENIRDFTVIYSGPQLLGCGALHFYTPTSGEIRSLAVAPEARKQGVGVFLTTTLEKEAINNDLQAIFAFTYVPDFFRKLGFRQVDRGLLPSKYGRIACLVRSSSAAMKSLYSKPLRAIRHPPYHSTTAKN